MSPSLLWCLLFCWLGVYLAAVALEQGRGTNSTKCLMWCGSVAGLARMGRQVQGGSAEDMRDRFLKEKTRS